MAAITIENLTKRYPDRGRNSVLALDNLSLDINEGEIFGYLGPNGAGKSTTIKILTALIRPTGGSCTIFGYPPEEARFHVRIGYVPEVHSYYPHLSVSSFLRYMSALGSSRRPLKERVENVVDKFDLEKSLDRKIGDLSMGWKQRVAIGAAFVDDPELLILDEPTTSLDPVAVDRFVGVLKEMREEGKTVLFSSHQLADVEKIADRVAIIKEGSLTTVGTISDITGSRDGATLNDVFLEVMEHQG